MHFGAFREPRAEGRPLGEKLVNRISNAERVRPAAIAAAVLFFCSFLFLTAASVPAQRGLNRRAAMGQMGQFRYAQLQARQNRAPNQRPYRNQQRPYQNQQRPNQNQQRPYQNPQGQYQPQQRPYQNQQRPYQQSPQYNPAQRQYNPAQR